MTRLMKMTSPSSTQGAAGPAFRLLIAMCCGLVLLAFQISAYAQPSSRYFGGLEFGFTTYRFDEKLDQKVVFSTANLTAGMAYGRFNFVSSLAYSFDKADVSEEDFTGSAHRYDLDLIVSYQIASEVSIFGGYKLGGTKLRSTLREEEDEAGVARTELFKQGGVFLGVSYTWQFEDAGRLSLSAAYANLDSDNKFVSDGDGADEGEAPEFDDITGKTSGSSTGFSYNLTWTKPLKGNLLYRTKLRFNRYEQDIKFQGTTFRNIDENSTSILIGVMYVI